MREFDFRRSLFQVEKRARWVPLLWPVGRGKGFAPEVNAETKSKAQSIYFVGL